MEFIRIIVLVLIVISAYITVYRSSLRTVEITVNSKERVGSREESKYLVFCEEGVFECVDSLSFFKFDSSDTYGHLKPEKKYVVEVAGWRIKIMSQYPNIIRIK